MIDLFAVNRFVIFLRMQYPEIELHIKYDMAFLN